MTRSERLTLALLDQLPGAIAVIDLREPSWPVVIANQPLADLRGLTREQVCGAGLTGLIGELAGSTRLEELRAGLSSGETISLRVALHDAAHGPYSAEIRFEPLKDDAGAVTHYAAFHDRIGLGATRVDGESPARAPVARDDRLTGLRHIDLFHEFFRRDFAIAQREGRTLTVFVCDIDALGIYNDTFGRQAGDTVIRRVGRALVTGMRRASDLVSRVEGGRFVGLVAALDADQAERHARMLAARVRDLHLHHPRSPSGKFVTVTVGFAHALPGPEDTPERLLRSALQSVESARGARGQGVAGGD